MSNSDLSVHQRSRANRRCAIALVSVIYAAVSPFPLCAAANLASPTGTDGLVMVDKVGGQVRFYDPRTNEELASLVPSDEPGLKPHELAISPDHKTLYVTIYGDGIYGNNPHPGHTIAVIDLPSKKRVGSIDLSPCQAPHGIQVDVDGRIYVTCDLSRKVFIVEPKSREIAAAIDVQGTGHWIALAQNAHKLYVANKNDKPFISVIDLKQMKMIGTIPMPNGTQGIVAAPDGKTVLAADFAEPFIHILSTKSDSEVDKVRVQGAQAGLYKVFFSPDGQKVLTCLPNGQVNIFVATNLHAPQRVVHSGGSNVMGFAFSADGKLALAGNHGEGTVSRIDLATATVLDTFAAGRGVETLAYY